MVFIHKGHFMMGNNKQSAVFDEPDNQMMATVDAFWMDETEITNNEYKQFVDWVRDSIAYDMLIQSSEENAEIYAKPLIKSADAELDTDTANGKRKKKSTGKRKFLGINTSRKESKLMPANMQTRTNSHLLLLHCSMRTQGK